MPATKAPLLAFFSGSSQFASPIYQWTHAWTERVCRQLWNDINRAGNDALPICFTGRIVYIEAGLSQVIHGAVSPWPSAWNWSRTSGGVLFTTTTDLVQKLQVARRELATSKPGSRSTAVVTVDRLIHHVTILEMNAESDRRRKSLETAGQNKVGRPAELATTPTSASRNPSSPPTTVTLPMARTHDPRPPDTRERYHGSHRRRKTAPIPRAPEDQG